MDKELCHSQRDPDLKDLIGNCRVSKIPSSGTLRCLAVLPELIREMCSFSSPLILIDHWKLLNASNMLELFADGQYLAIASLVSTVSTIQTVDHQSWNMMTRQPAKIRCYDTWGNWLWKRRRLCSTYEKFIAWMRLQWRHVWIHLDGFSTVLFDKASRC